MPEFRLLGLEPREARAEVIRSAVTEAAGEVKSASEEDPSDQRLAEVAVAGYHLLDPRRRRNQFERIQLLLWTEEELDAESSGSFNTTPSSAIVDSQNVSEEFPMLTAQLARIKARPAINLAPPPVASSPLEERRAALAVFKSLRRQDRRATALWISLLALALGLPAAVLLTLAWVS